MAICTTLSRRPSIETARAPEPQSVLAGTTIECSLIDTPQGIDRCPDEDPGITDDTDSALVNRVGATRRGAGAFQRSSTTGVALLARDATACPFACGVPAVKDRPRASPALPVLTRCPGGRERSAGWRVLPQPGDVALRILEIRERRWSGTIRAFLRLAARGKPRRNFPPKPRLCPTPNCKSSSSA